MPFLFWLPYILASAMVDLARQPCVAKPRPGRPRDRIDVN